VKLVAFGDFDGAAENFFGRRRKILSRISSVSKHIPYIFERFLVQHEHLERAISVGHIRRRHQNRMRQSIRIDRNMPLDSRHQFTTIKALFFGCVGVFYTLGIDNNESGFRLPAIENERLFD
jgi:hypothetical protein